MLITTALKEWSVAVDALAQGDTILLLRKGGIREQQGKFAPLADRVLLFPTFEHQKPELLKPAYRTTVKAVEKGWHPSTLTFKAWADITHIFLTDDAAQVAALAAFHIWQPTLAQDRLRWKPKQPLYVLTLRAYRLSEPVTVPWQPAYGGCRSWLDLSGLNLSGLDGSADGQARANAGIEVGDGAEPAIAAAEYQKQVDAIAAILTPEKPLQRE